MLMAGATAPTSGRASNPAAAQHQPGGANHVRVAEDQDVPLGVRGPEIARPGNAQPLCRAHQRDAVHTPSLKKSVLPSVEPSSTTMISRWRRQGGQHIIHRAAQGLALVQADDDHAHGWS